MAQGLTAGIMSAAAAAAKTARDLGIDLGDGDEATDGAAEPDRVLQQTEARLEEILKINRLLHSTLTEKKRQMKQSEQETVVLQKKLAGWAAEEPARKASIDDLQSKTSKAVPLTGKMLKEVNLLNRDTNRLQDRIADLNGDNLHLAQVHREERQKLTEQHSRLRTLGRRERELGRQLELVAAHFNEVLWEKKHEAEFPDEAGGNAGSKSAEALRALSTDEQQIEDFRQLPGLSFNKLIVRSKDQEPPTLDKHVIREEAGLEDDSHHDAASPSAAHGEASIARTPTTKKDAEPATAQPSAQMGTPGKPPLADGRASPEVVTPKAPAGPKSGGRPSSRLNSPRSSSKAS